MENKNGKAFLYLLPAILFLGCFMVYPLIDVGGIQFCLPDLFFYWNLQFFLCTSRSLFSAGSEEYPSDGCDHGTHFYRDRPADLTGAQLYRTVAEAVPDYLFPAVCDEYTGSWSGIHDFV